ncbi:hypothetical protein JCM6882_003643 [Rhodosporidiobolus microsporus]
MSVPRTPTKPRTASPLSPAPSRPTTPARAAGGVARTKAAGPGGVTASPQVKAALAALRKQRQASSSSSLNNEPSTSDSPQDPFMTPAKPAHERQRTSSSSATASTSSGGGGSTAGRASSPAKGKARRDEVLLEWAVKPEDKLIEEAKKTGLLNLASRELAAVPPSVYSSLLPRTSSYHPSNREPRSAFRRDRQPDLRIASFADDEDAERAAAWYEQQDLRSLNLSSNEIGELGEEIGGFEGLELLDLHNNALPALPPSLAWLTHLTSLNLSHNRLSSFPLALLNLRLLRDLNLAGNQLTRLWPSNSWKDALADVLTPPGASPSATPESPERTRNGLGGGGGESFWDSFPSSPFHRKNNKLDGLPHPSQSRAPFPLLTTLSLAENPLARDAFLPSAGGGDAREGETGVFDLPPRLTNLDLSECGLVDGAVPPEVFGRLRHLVELDLSRNDLADDLFAADLFPSPPPTTSAAAAGSAPLLFPSLRTLDLSLNPIDSLFSLEAFLTARVQRPISYAGLARPVQNLIAAEERAPGRRGRRIGVPLPTGDGDEGTAEGPEVCVKVAECLLREEQVRRRRAFPESEASRAREREREEEKRREGETTAALAAGLSSTVPPPTARIRSLSPSPPPSPSPTPATSSAPSAAASARAPAPATPTRRPPVVLEDWEVEAAAGLTTPAGRRRAAALAAREREERREREKRERERQKEEEEVESRLRDVKIGKEEEEERTVDASTSRSASVSPPPYSPRAPSPSAPAPEPAAAASISSPQPAASAPSSLPSSTPAPAAEASPSDPAVALLSSALSLSSAGRSSLTLTARSLTAFPVPTTGSPPSSLAPPSSVDLARNAFPAVPLRGLEVWGWNLALKSLCLSRNRVAALEVLGSSAAGATSFFPHLETLDLSHNWLPSTVSSPFPAEDGTTIPLFDALARLAPALVTLNLHHNRLTTLDGIATLVLPPPPSSSSSSSASSSPPGGVGVKHLNLSENKVADVEGLVEAAKGYAALRGAAERGRWRLEDLDLSSNDIAKLPPHLGLLPPTLLLHLTGNTFRIPRREVYENAAERRAIPYLREWLEGLGGA